MNTSFSIEMDVTIHSGCASIGFGGVNKSNFYSVFCAVYHKNIRIIAHYDSICDEYCFY